MFLGAVYNYCVKQLVSAHFFLRSWDFHTKSWESWDFEMIFLWTPCNCKIYELSNTTLYFTMYCFGY